MKKIRVIARLDIKSEHVVKGIQLEGLRKIGNPAELAKKYYLQGADELLYVDTVATLYNRNNLTEVLKETVSKGVYIPVTVAGGIRNIADVKKALRNGADKVAINTAATRDPTLITQASEIFGSQCIVGSIEAKKVADDKWEAYTNNGREKTGLDAIEWAKELEKRGAGELLITSVDKDGVQKGYDVELLEKISQQVKIPVIASGGAKDETSVVQCVKETSVDAVAVASILHYNKTDIKQIKNTLKDEQIPVRTEMSINYETTSNEKKEVSIIDYEAGNLMSVTNAFQRLGNPVKIVSTPEEIMQAKLLVLPGDGAFKFGMEKLKEKKLCDAITQHIQSNKPFLGICLGMQLLMSKSLEFGETDGLNIIEGEVIPFEVYENFPIPHMGWSEIDIKKSQPIVSGIPKNSQVYFVHSFKVIPKNEENILSTTNYAKQEFCSAIIKNKIFGTQFHPEKSGGVGLKILENFSNM